jgi:hypothetical protein
MGDAYDGPDYNDNATSVPSDGDNYFSQFENAPAAAAPASNDNYFAQFEQPPQQKPPDNYFAQFEQQTGQPELPQAESPFWSGVRKFAHGIGPTLAGAAAGAATMGGYGAAAGTLGLPGLGTLGGTLIGGAAGLVTGGVSGYLASEAQEAAAKALNFDDSLQQAANEEANPGSTLIGGALTAAVPFGMGRGVVTLGQRAFSGALMGGVETGSELAEGKPFDPAAIALNVGMGAAFTQPRKFLTPFESAGARLGTRLTEQFHGKAGPDAAGGVAQEQPSPKAGTTVEPGAAPATPEAVAPGGDRGGPEDYGKEAPAGEPAPTGIYRDEQGKLQGKLRLYRGETPGAGAAMPGSPMGGGWYTTDLAKAQKYGDVNYIDITPADLNKFAQGHGGTDEYVLPDKQWQDHFRSQSKPLEQPAAAAVQQGGGTEGLVPDPALDAAIRAKMAPGGEAAAPPPEQEPAAPATPAAPSVAAEQRPGDVLRGPEPGAPPPEGPISDAGGGGAGGKPPPPGGPGGPPPGSITPLPPTQPQRFQALRKLIRSYKETFQPETISPRAFEADPLFAKRAVSTQGEDDRIINDGLKREALWNKTPEADRVGFLSDIENKRQPQNPVFRTLAQTYSKMLDAAYTLEKQYGSKAGYIEDYFPHLWERPNTGQAPIADYMRQTIGPTGFQKARTIDLIEHGLAAGYKLKSTNPELLVRARLMAGADMRNTMELLDSLKKTGMADRTEGADPQAMKALSRMGWQIINAPDRKQWAIAPDVLPLWNNTVAARGLWADQGLAGDAFRGWMGFKAAWVPVKLALSLFHPLHVAHINFSSSVARATDQALTGDLAGALKSFGQAVSLRQPIGEMGRAQWLLGDGARTPEGRIAVRDMEDGGFAPMLSKELSTDAGRKLTQAWQDMSPLKVGYEGLRFAIHQIQKPLFEQWIPHLKTAAYLNDVAAFAERRPDLYNDPAKRGIALRAIAKSVDNRFGEMFYGGLFWNRYVKDASIGSFLSLGWNLGFAREFGGAAVEAATRPLGRIVPGMAPNAARQIARDATNKIKFASIYMGTAALIGGVMTKMLSGEDPKDLSDCIFPRVGGVNPDGSPRRLSTMFYLREIPMLQKHIEEQGGGIGGTLGGAGAMLWNKTLFQPLKELWENRDYFGREIWDTNAPGYQQIEQAMKHIATGQLSPMSVSGAQRAQETGGQPIETPLAYLGFGPAPAYANRSAIQNRIGYLYQRFVAPETRPYQDEDVTQAQQAARSQILLAKQHGNSDELNAAYAAAQKAGITGKSMVATGKLAGDQFMFSKLPQQEQTAVLDEASPAERVRYLPHALKATKVAWNAAHQPQAAAALQPPP